MSHGSPYCVLSVHNYATLNNNSSIVESLRLNKQRFCDSCNYKCLLLFKVSNDPYYEKIRAIVNAFEQKKCESVMWVDFDSVFVYPFQIDFAKDWFSKDFCGLNSGNFVLQRNTDNLKMLAFLQNITVAEKKRYSYHEQGAIKFYSRNHHFRNIKIADIVKYGVPARSRLQRDLPIWHAAGLSKTTHKSISFLETALKRTNFTGCKSLKELQHLHVRDLKREDMSRAFG